MSKALISCVAVLSSIVSSVSTWGAIKLNQHVDKPKDITKIIEKFQVERRPYYIDVQHDLSKESEESDSNGWCILVPSYVNSEEFQDPCTKEQLTEMGVELNA